MSPEAPKPQIIDSVPGMEPFSGNLPSREVTSIPESEATPQMRANAMFSPENVHPGAFVSRERLTVEETPAAEVVGTAVTSSLVELDQASVTEAPAKNEFADLWNVDDSEDADVEAAAVRSPRSSDNNIEIRVRQQMGIDAADRKLRTAAGLPPRTFNLK